MNFTNSPLVSHVNLSPNHSGQRKNKIDRITPHCVVGQCSVETLGKIFEPTSRQASSNYGIGVDGRVGMYVEEKNRSWCSSSSANDHRAITIECASDVQAPYAFKDIVYNKLIDLCVDICQRNGKKKLLWFGDRNKTLNYTPAPDEMMLTVHRWFANKSCPGDWLYNRLGDLASKVTQRLDDNALYYIRIGDFKKEKAEEILSTIKQAFSNATIEKSNQSVTPEPAPVPKPEPKKDIIVGSNVKLRKGAKTYTVGGLASFVYDRVHQVKEIKGDRVVITYQGTVIAAVKLSDLSIV